MKRERECRIRLIIGLGNPGERYQKSRHNVGFMAVSALSKEWRIECRKKRSYSLIGRGFWKSQEVWLARPMTYMNASGQAVEALIKSTKVGLQDLVVICDDLALPLGSVRLRASGSSGGHKGLEGIITQLKSDQFPRLRVGIGPFPPRILPSADLPLVEDASQFVLDAFSKEEIEKITALLKKIPEICQIWLEEGIQKGMSFANRSQIPPFPPPFSKGGIQVDGGFLR